MKPHAHTPDECINFVTHKPLKFSHKRYFEIEFRKILYRNRDNSPHLSARSFANLTEYDVFGRDGDRVVDKKKLRKAKSLYIKSDEFLGFIETWSDYVVAKTLVVGGTDTNFRVIPELPEGVNLVLLQNSAILDSKIIKTLPLGIEDIHLGRAGLSRYHMSHQRDDSNLKVFVPPMSPTNPIRREVILQCMENKGVFDVEIQLKQERIYFDEVKRYNFVLCLEGNGHENHRIWETLYQGSFPILLRSNWSISLEYLNLPFLFVDSVQEIDRELLQDFLQENRGFNPKSCEILWTPYWKKVIQNSKV